MNWSRWLQRFLSSLILLLISWLLLTAAYVSLGRQFVPALADYKTELIEWFERETGRAIDLHNLQAEMQGSQPVLTLQGLRVYEAAGRESPILLELEHVIARIDVFASLWQRKLVMDALQLEGLALEFIEDADNQWRLSGLGQSNPDSDGLDRALEHLFDQRRITLLDSSIRISPWAQSDWVFSGGDLTLLNRGHHHQLDARMRLPDQQVVSLQLTGELPERDWRHADLRFFADLPSSDWNQWLPAELLEQAHIDNMVAGGQVWGHWQQLRLNTFSGQLRAPVVELDLPRQAPPIEDLHLQFSLKLDADEQRLDIEQLSMQVEQSRWSGTRMQLIRHPNRGDWQARINHVPLELLGQWLPAAFANEQIAEILSTLAPAGELRGVLASGTDLDDVANWSLLARLHGVGVQAWNGVPALTGINGVISGTPSTGELLIDTGEWSMHLPVMFPERWHYQGLTAAANWVWSEQQGLELNVPGALVQGEEGEISARLHLDLPPPGGTPAMDLRVALRDSRAEHYARYLPTRSPAMQPALAEWLQASDLSGITPLVIFAYEGSLLKAATSEERTISLYAELEQGRLNFQPDWPALEQVEASLYLRDIDLNIYQARGQLLQTSLENIDVTLGRTDDQALQLLINGAFDGPLQDGLQIMQQTPLSGMTGDPLNGWSGEGGLQGELKLGVPLGNGQRPDVHLQLQAQATRLDIPLLQTPLRNLSGDFTYQHGTGLTSDAISLGFLGQPVSARLDASAGNHHLRLSGTHNMDNLRSWPMLGMLPEKLARGRASWNADLWLGGNLRRLQVQSDLQGVQLDLPGELAKPTGSRLPSRLQLDMGDPSRWQFQLGDDLRGVLLERDGKLSGDIRYRQGIAQQPSGEGIYVSARFDHIELDQWRSWWDDGLSSPRSSANPDKTEAVFGLLSGVHVQAGRMQGFGLDLQELEVSARPDAEGWRLITEHPQLSGQIHLPSSDNQPIVLTLQRLGFPRRSNVRADTQGLIEPLVPEDPLQEVKPSNIPAMQVRIEQVYWGDELVGATSFNMQPSASALDISAIKLSLRGGLELSGEMNWSAERTRFDGTLSARNIGQVLSAWQYAPTITSKSFQAQVGLDWPGSPAWFALKRSSGSMALQAEDGTLQSGEASADALRVFGLLNFNALTRRLRLDFSDLFGKGIAYDTFTGEAALTNGLLQTISPLVMDGPSAKLQLDGTLDLSSDRVDMGLLVTLPVTNNLPLAAIIAGAPHIGGVLFLVDRILGDRVARFASVRYRISDNWKQPTVEFDRAFDDKPALED